MDVVLGVSMSPSTIRTVLAEGESADCVTVEAHDLEVAPADESVTTAVDQVVTAVLDARAGADEAGDQLCSTGVTWTDEVEVAGLRAALAEHKVHNVMLVSAFLAAAALAQAVGQVIGYGRIAMLFLEPECATLAVVDAADGSISDVHKELLHSADATAEVIEMVAGLESLETCPAGLFVVGSGVDVAPIKSRLETETSLAVTTPEEPETALARGAALASANAPLFASSTAALAYAQDPGTGEVDLDAVAPGYFYVPDAPSAGEPGEEELAYSALPDEEADALTEVMDTAEGDSPTERRRRPVLLLGSAGAVVAISAVLAMEVALALGIRPGVALRPSTGHNLIVPARQAPAPAGPQLRNIPQPSAVAVPHPLNPPAPGAPPPAAPAPAPIPAAPPVPVLVPLPAVPVPDSPPAPLNLPAPQPPMQVPASPPTQVPVSPPTHVPVSHPPVHVPVPPPPVHVPEPQPPVNSPSPDGPPAPGHPGHEAPPVPGLPGLEPPAAPGIPGHEAPPAPDTSPARGDESGPGGGPGEVGGHGSGGGADEGGAGTGSHGSSGGSEIGGGSIGGGSPSGGGAEISGSSSSGSSSSGGGSSSESGGGGHR
jgi:hypothetical protein